MSSELERRLESLLTEAPEPDPGAGEEALHRALRALQPAAPTHRGLRTAVLVFAAAAVLLAIAAGSLAAAGALHVSFGAKKKPPRAATGQLSLPQGANGVAAIVDGRLSVAIKGGFRLQGLPASAVALSPARALRRGRDRPLARRAGAGRAPHVVTSRRRRGRRDRLGAGRLPHRVRRPRTATGSSCVRSDGNGTHDTLIDRSVRPVRPRGAPTTSPSPTSAEAVTRSSTTSGTKGTASPGRRPRSRRVSFAPSGKTLAVATPGSAVLGGKTVVSGDIEALGWRDGRLAVAVEQGVTPPLVRMFRQNGRPAGSFHAPGRVVAVSGGFVVSQTPKGIVAGQQLADARTVLT